MNNWLDEVDDDQIEEAKKIVKEFLANDESQYTTIEVDGRPMDVLTKDAAIEYKIQEQNNRLYTSGIPKRYYDLTYDDVINSADRYNTEERRKKMEGNIRQLERFKNALIKKKQTMNLYLYSPEYGSGKTTAMCATGISLIRKGLVTRFVLAGDLIDSLLKVQGFNVELDADQKRKEYLSCDLLLIDDIFDPAKSLMWKNSSDMIISEWDRFMRNALSNNVSIIMTSNCSMYSIATNFGSALSALIQRDFTELKFNWSVKESRKKDTIQLRTGEKE